MLLTWQPPVNTPDLKIYILYRGLFPGFPLTPLTRYNDLPNTATSYMDVVLTTSYFYILQAEDYGGLVSAPTNEVVMIPTAVGDSRKNRPREFELAQNYPNPFNANTTISFSVSSDKKGTGELAVYNIVGQKIRVLSSGEFKAGTYSFTWDGKDQNGTVLPTGVYFYSLQIGQTRQTKKMVLVK